MKVADTAIAGARHSFAVPISVSLALAAAAATIFPASARAQAAAATTAPSAAGQGQLAEVVVTALKRSTNIQQTPVSMSAIGAQQLTDQGITDSSQLSRVAPNLIINQGSNGTDRLTIRDIYAAGEPTVGLYYDDTPVTGSVGVTSDAGGSTPDIQLFDVQRVEVLRGPQGTLYGAGSMAGTVRLIFNQPNLRRFGGTAAAQVESVTGGDVGYDTQAEVNGHAGIPVLQ